MKITEKDLMKKSRRYYLKLYAVISHSCNKTKNKNNLHQNEFKIEKIILQF